jgi:hypothetical protein
VLQDGREFRGLVQSESERWLDFAEIVQRPGEATFAVVRGIDRQQVKSVERLPEEERRDLMRRFAELRQRAVIEAGRMESVPLREALAGQRPALVYEGDWFTLVSTADEESTRRCVVRIEQIFRAYRTLLPPRASAARRLEIRLYAALDEFRQELRTLRLDLDNPAYYDSRQGRIVAACELVHYARRLAEARREAQDLERQYEELEGEFRRRLAEIGDELRRAGFREGEITSELNLRKAAWAKEKEAAFSRARQQMRRNEARFGEVTAAMLRRLSHEALHAWLDLYVFPASEHHVPRWLHEGLAQVFESGQLEGDTLRLDAPDWNKLRQLQASLASTSPLALWEILAALERPYAGRHGDESQLHYLYAWGVAHHLVFGDGLLTRPALRQYVAAEAAEMEPAARFERLTGVPLADWERNWRAAMLALSPPAR